MDGNKKLIEGKFRNECVEFLAPCNWIFTEKVDGTNVRIIWDGHKVTFGGRTDNAQMPMPLMERLKELFEGNTNEELFEQKFGENQVVFYGEGYGGKIQSGTGYKQEQDFILFDVKVGETWLKREDVENIAKTFNLDVVPVVLQGTIQEAVEYVKTRPNSPIAQGEKLSEGLVGVPAARLTDFRGNRIIVKIKECDF
jgi:ATP-dependent RNA circularization protein (DNA/RNA ligase family)